GHPDSLRAKVVIVDWSSLLAPNPSRILEVADQFFLLRIDADDRQAALEELFFLLCHIGELLIALWAIDRERLCTGMQSLAPLVHESAQGVGTDLDIQVDQFSGDLAQAFSRPQSTPAHRIAGRILLQQADQPLQDIGRFFSARGRPAPARRTRSFCTCPAKSSRRPRATVSTSSPRLSAMF